MAVCTRDFVLRQRLRFRAHDRRPHLRSDLDYPIDLLARDQLVVLDGVHRLLKADVLGMRAIAARVLDASRLHEIIA